MFFEITRILGLLTLTSDFTIINLELMCSGFDCSAPPLLNQKRLGEQEIVKDQLDNGVRRYFP